MNNYKEHQALINRAKLLASKEIPKLRIFDRHVGLFYKKRTSGNMIDYTPIHINKKGMSDLDITYPGKYCLIRIEAEAKTGRGEQTEDQINWQNFIQSMNGFYFVFRTEVEFVTTIQGYLSYLESKGVI